MINVSTDVVLSCQYPIILGSITSVGGKIWYVSGSANVVLVLL